MTIVNKVVDSRWFLRGLAVIAIGALIFTAVRVIFVSNAVNAVRESSIRNDCRSAYNAEFTEKIRQRDALSIEQNRELGVALFNSVQGVRSTPEQVEAFRTTNLALGKAADAVAELPKLDDAVDHGYTLDGVHHPPCPTVG